MTATLYAGHLRVATVEVLAVTGEYPPMLWWSAAPTVDEALPLRCFLRVDQTGLYQEVPAALVTPPEVTP